MLQSFLYVYICSCHKETMVFRDLANLAFRWENIVHGVFWGNNRDTVWIDAVLSSVVKTMMDVNLECQIRPM